MTTPKPDIEMTDLMIRIRERHPLTYLPDVLALEALNEIDPERKAPPMVRVMARERLRQLAMEVCARPDTYAKMPSQDLVDRLVAEIAERARVPAEAIFGKDKRRAVAYARFRVFKRLHALGYGLAPIARRFKCNHCSVRYGIQHDLPDDYYPALKAAEQLPKKIRIVPPPKRGHRHVRVAA